LGRGVIHHPKKSFIVLPLIVPLPLQDLHTAVVEPITIYPLPLQLWHFSETKKRTRINWLFEFHRANYWS